MAASSEPYVQEEESRFLSHSRKKIRIIAKVRDFLGQWLDSCYGCPSSHISVEDPSGESKDQVNVRISDQETGKSEGFELDYYYGKDENMGSVFSKEIRPLLSCVFGGRDSTIFFYGGISSGKNAVIQGLIPLCISEILSISEKAGHSIGLSCFEVRCQSHLDKCYDLLESREVSVWEDKEGRTQLRGLSQVPIRSISDFNAVLLHFMGSGKFYQKGSLEAPRKSHRGVTVFVSRKCEQEFNVKVVGKVNFIDLAGYDNMKQNTEASSHKIQSARVNKSLCDLLRVVQGLNMNENGIAWRESKLARILRGSLGGESQSLFIACLNPNSYQESAFTLGLLTRPYQSITGGRKDTERRKQDTSLKLKPTSTPSKFQNPFNPLTKSKNVERRPLTISTPRKLQSPLISSKAPNNSRFNFKSKMPTAACATKERRKQDTVNISALTAEEENMSSNILHIEDPSVVLFSEERLVVEQDTCLQNNQDAGQATEISNAVEILSISEDATLASPSPKERNGYNANKNLSTKFNGDPSPISAKLKAMKENLQSFNSVPLGIGTITPCKGHHMDDPYKANLEPITPKIFSDAIVNTGTPLDKFNAMSNGIKKSLIQEYLSLLNTATKEELMEMKGIGEKRAQYILQLREDSPEPLKEISDLKKIGLSNKQINDMLRKAAGGMFP